MVDILLVNGDRVSAQDDVNVLEMHSRDGHTLGTYLMPPNHILTNG